MDFFSDALIGQLVVLFLLLLVTLRPLLKKSKHLETLSVLSIVTVCLSIILILVFGLSLSLLFCTILALLVLLTNLTPIYRVMQGLYSDRNAFLFCLCSYIEAFAIIVCICLCIFFRPMPTNIKEHTKTLYSGSFSRGFVEKDNPFDKTNAVITEFSASDDFDIDPSIAIVYLNPLFTASTDSTLRLSAIADMGIPVIAGDFYSLDAPTTNTPLDSPININPVFTPFTLHFMQDCNTEQRTAFLLHKELELEFLLTIAGQKYSSVIVIAEGDTRNIALQAKQKYPYFVLDVFSLTNDAQLEEYYNNGIGDFILLNPLDALLSQFESWKKFDTVTEYARDNKPHLRYARQIITKTENILKEN